MLLRHSLRCLKPPVMMRNYVKAQVERGGVDSVLQAIKSVDRKVVPGRGRDPSRLDP